MSYIIKYFADMCKTANEIVIITGICLSTVYYHLRKLKDPDYHNKTRGRTKKITEVDTLNILQYIIEKPRSTLQEIIDACELNISVSTLSRHLKTIGVTRKKVTRHNSKRDTEEYVKRCKKFFEELLAVLNSDMCGSLVSVDECGVTTNLTRDYAWGFKGERVHVSDDFNTHERTSVIGAIGYKGERLVSYVNGSVHSEEFIEFLGKLFDVLPDGSCVLMDNARIHVSKKVKDFCANYHSIHVVYLPPYTPEYSPIEPVWAQLKNELKDIGLRKTDQNNLKFICDKILSAMEKQFFQNCFSHSINIMKENFKLFCN